MKLSPAGYFILFSVLLNSKEVWRDTHHLWRCHKCSKILVRTHIWLTIRESILVRTSGNIMSMLRALEKPLSQWFIWAPTEGTDSMKVNVRRLVTTPPISVNTRQGETSSRWRTWKAFTPHSLRGTSDSPYWREVFRISWVWEAFLQSRIFSQHQALHTGDKCYVEMNVGMLSVLIEILLTTRKFTLGRSLTSVRKVVRPSVRVNPVSNKRVKVSLTWHWVLHAREQAHMCWQCRKAFSQTSKLVD